jgi:hypothetical protein
MVTWQALELLFKGLIVLLVVLLLWDNSRMREQNERLESDVSGLSVALQIQMDTTRNVIGQMMAKTQTVVLSNEQAKAILQKETKEIKERFDVRISGLKSFSQAGAQYTLPIMVPGKDTIIYNNTERVFHTPYGKLFTNGDSLEGTLSIQDTVRIIVSKGKREKWWKIWEKRPLVTNAFMSSPNGTITSLKSVLVE